MKTKKVKKLANRLKTTGRVEFMDKGILFMIWDVEDGWMLNKFKLDLFLDGDRLESFDGGLCTGSARDAVEFLL